MAHDEIKEQLDRIESKLVYLLTIARETDILVERLSDKLNTICSPQLS